MVVGADGLCAQPLACPNKQMIPDPGRGGKPGPETTLKRGESQAGHERDS